MMILHSAYHLSGLPFRAAFHIFQSYLAEFGVIFDEKEVCYWLSLAAEEDEKLEVNVPAMA